MFRRESELSEDAADDVGDQSALILGEFDPAFLGPGPERKGKTLARWSCSLRFNSYQTEGWAFSVVTSTMPWGADAVLVFLLAPNQCLWFQLLPFLSRSHWTRPAVC